MEQFKNLTINQSEYTLKNGNKAKIAVFIYAGSADPDQVLDHAVYLYTAGKMYHELIDSSMDNPWMRVILSDINDMTQKPFDPITDKM